MSTRRCHDCSSLRLAPLALKLAAGTASTVSPGVDLRGVNFTGLDLDGIALAHTDLDNSSSRDASLREARLDGVILGDADLRGACIANAQLSAAQLRFAKLRRTWVVSAPPRNHDGPLAAVQTVRARSSRTA